MHSMNDIKCSTISPYVLKPRPSLNVKYDTLNPRTKRNACPIHLTILKFIALIIIGEKYKY